MTKPHNRLMDRVCWVLGASLLAGGLIGQSGPHIRGWSWEPTPWMVMLGVGLLVNAAMQWRRDIPTLKDRVQE